MLCLSSTNLFHQQNLQLLQITNPLFWAFLYFWGILAEIQTAQFRGPPILVLIVGVPNKYSTFGLHISLGKQIKREKYLQTIIYL